MGGVMPAIFCICIIAFLFSNASAVDDLQTLNNSLESTSDETERADIYKKIGDYFATIGDYEQASEAYLQALPLIRDSLSFSDHINIAKSLSWAKKFNDSLTELQLIIRDQPSNCEAILHLARVYLWTRNTDESITAFQKAGETCKDTENRAAAFKELAQIYVSKNNIEKAANAFAEALPTIRKEMTDDEKLEVAKYLSWGRQYDKAIIELNVLLEDNPSNCNVNLHLSRVLTWNGQIDDAIIAYEKAKQACSDPNKKALIYKELGEIYISKNNMVAASQEFLQALSTPNIFPVEEKLQMVEYISQGGNKEASIQELNRILESNPGNSKARKLLVQEKLRAEGVAGLENILHESPSAREQAFIYKEIGDFFIKEGDYKAAAPHFISTLQLGRDYLSIEERIQIAKYISWGGRFEEAIAELKLIIADNPANQKARLHLARVLAWDTRFTESLWEAEQILEESPNNTDALLIKANALRWRGDVSKSIPVYENALSSGEDFNARLGLAYSHLLIGRIGSSKKDKELLKPANQYQQEELESFNQELFRTSRPNFDLRYSFYKDTDDNEVNRYTSGFNFWLGNWRNGLQYVYIDAKDDNGRNTYAHNISLNTNSRISEIFSIGSGVGLYLTGKDNDSQYVTWQVKTEIDILNGNAGMRVSRDGLPVTAELIDNGIRLTNTLLYIQQRLTDRFSLYGSYTYRDYSDDNNANDFFISTNYLIYSKNPRVNIGYRFRYMDFNRQSRGGYFDPNDFISHQMYSTISFRKNKFYGYLEPFIGYESYRRYGDQSDDFVGGAYGYLGYRLSRHFSIELNGEGGNYAATTGAGWNYYQFGSRVLVIL